MAVPATGMPPPSSRRTLPATVAGAIASVKVSTMFDASGTPSEFGAGTTDSTRGRAFNVNNARKSPPDSPSPDGSAPLNSPSSALTEESDKPSSCSPETRNTM